MLSMPRDLNTKHVAIIQKDNKIERTERIMFISNQNLKSKRPTTIEIVNIPFYQLLFIIIIIIIIRNIDNA